MTYFVGLTPLAVVVTSLVALWLTPTPAATLDCLFVYHEHTAIGGDLTVSISGVTTLVECQAFLKDRSSRFAAVTYNDAKRECCGVLLGVNLSLQYEFGSFTLEVRHKNSSSTSIPHPAFSTTRAPIFNNTDANLVPSTIGNNTYLVKAITVRNVTIAQYKSDRNYFYWDQARSACESVGWELAYLPTEELLTAVLPNFETFAWIGVLRGSWIKSGVPVASKYLLQTTYEWNYKPYGAKFGNNIYGYDHTQVMYNVLCSST